MYRGKDLGTREELIEKCQHLLESADAGRLYPVLPHLSLLRCESFVSPLSDLLTSRERAKQLFAAMALGAVGHPSSLGPLVELFQMESTLSGRGSRSLQTAIIVAIGEIGAEGGVAALEEILDLDRPGDAFKRRRRKLVVTALGKLLQRDVSSASLALQALAHTAEPPIRAAAGLELGLGYWHTPNDVPRECLDTLLELASDTSEEVRLAALSAIHGLAQVGCREAEELLS